MHVAGTLGYPLQKVKCEAYVQARSCAGSSGYERSFTGTCFRVSADMDALIMTKADIFQATTSSRFSGSIFQVDLEERDRNDYLEHVQRDK